MMIMDPVTVQALVIGSVGIFIGWMVNRFCSCRETTALCSKWHDCDVSSEYAEFCAALKKGDIVELRHKGIRDTLWTVCAGDAGKGHRVIYRCDQSCRFKICFKDRCEGEFYEDTLRGVSGDSEIRINNARDNLSGPKPAREIVRCSRGAVAGKDGVFGKYNPVTNSSKHFAARARYERQAVDNRLSKDRGGFLGRWWDTPHCSSWFEEKDLETFRWLLEDGDLVEFDRGPYSHWAVCQNSDTLAMTHRSGSNLSTKGPIVSTGLKAVILGCRFRINNSLDSRQSPRGADEISDHASECCESKAFGKYNLLMNNCKKFAEYVRYGIHFRKNLQKSSGMFSAPEMRTSLVVGDIIRYWIDLKIKKYDIQYAIYVGTELDSKGLPQVVYRRYPSGSRGGAALVLAKPLADLLAVPSFKFTICNFWDSEYTPVDVKIMVEAVRKAVDCEDPCECDFFRGSCPHFALSARYGTAARDTLVRELSGWCSPKHLEEFVSNVPKTGDHITVTGDMSKKCRYEGDGLVQPLLVNGKPTSDDKLPLVEFLGNGICARNNSIDWTF